MTFGLKYDTNFQHTHLGDQATNRVSVILSSGAFQHRRSQVCPVPWPREKQDGS